jgi:hypothetical protein
MTQIERAFALVNMVLIAVLIYVGTPYAHAIAAFLFCAYLWNLAEIYR